MAKKKEVEKEEKKTTKKTEKKKSVHEVTVKIEGSEWEAALDEAFKKKQKTVKVDGFRAGKVPRSVFEKKFGKESLFLDAAILLSNSDGNMSDQEKEIILQLCEEMQIKPTFSSSRQLESALREMSTISNLKTKKIFVFELAGVILADGIFDESEKKIIIQMLRRG